jgi:hypothetical protein
MRWITWRAMSACPYSWAVTAAVVANAGRPARALLGLDTIPGRSAAAEWLAGAYADAIEDPLSEDTGHDPLPRLLGRGLHSFPV